MPEPVRTAPDTDMSEADQNHVIPNPHAHMSNDSVQYRLPGEINNRSGTYEIFARPSQSGRTEVITHRFFRPDPR